MKKIYPQYYFLYTNCVQGWTKETLVLRWPCYLAQADPESTELLPGIIEEWPLHPVVQGDPILHENLLVLALRLREFIWMW